MEKVEPKTRSSLLALPSLQEFYEVDGESPVEAFTIICSPEEVKEAEALLDSRIPCETWTSIEKDLIKQGEINLSQQAEKPFPIAGSVRASLEPGAGRSLVDKLKVFSGNTIVVKRYEFSVVK